MAFCIGNTNPRNIVLLYIASIVQFNLKWFRLRALDKLILTHTMVSIYSTFHRNTQHYYRSDIHSWLHHCPLLAKTNNDRTNRQ
jgi:hypothetical protein